MCYCAWIMSDAQTIEITPLRRWPPLLKSDVKPQEVRFQPTCERTVMTQKFSRLRSRYNQNIMTALYWSFCCFVSRSIRKLWLRNFVFGYLVSLYIRWVWLRNNVFYWLWVVISENCDFATMFLLFCKSLYQEWIKAHQSARVERWLKRWINPHQSAGIERW